MDGDFHHFVLPTNRQRIRQMIQGESGRIRARTKIHALDKSLAYTYDMIINAAQRPYAVQKIVRIIQ